MDIQKEREAFEATQNPIVFERIVYVEKANLFTMKDDFRDDLFTVNKCNELNFGWSSWQAAKAQEAEKLKGCVVVPLENVRFFSNDGENYEIHETLEEAKHEAECAIEYYSDRLADQQLDPRSDGNFQQISYGIVLAGSSYSVDHIVTQQDIDDGEYSYDVGTEIMSLFLVEAAQEQAND